MLLESDTLSLQIAYVNTNALDLAPKNADAYSMYNTHTIATSYTPQPSALSDDFSSSSSSSSSSSFSFSMVAAFHNRRVCQDCNVCCNRKVCRSNSSTWPTATIYEDTSATAAIHGSPTYNCTTGIIAAFPTILSHAAVHVSINGHTFTTLIDSCSSDSFMGDNITKMLKLKIKPSTHSIFMAISTMNTKISGTVGYTPSSMDVNIRMFASVYWKICVSVSFLAMIFRNSTNIWSSTWYSDSLSHWHTILEIFSKRLIRENVPSIQTPKFPKYIWNTRLIYYPYCKFLDISNYNTSGSNNL